MTIQLFGVNMQHTVSYAKAIVAWFILVALGFSLMSYKAAETIRKEMEPLSIKKESNITVDTHVVSEAEKTTVSLLATYPQAVSFIQQYAQKESEYYEERKEKAVPFFTVYDQILASYGLPLELKYLSVIESDLNKNCVSHAGAVGLWQLMPDAAKTFGLKVGGKNDERKDLTKSTHAAAKYLKQLYGRFNDWLLVVASYNCGPNRLARILNERSGKTFWDIEAYLPLETRNHVKKYLGMQYIFEGDNIRISPQTIDRLRQV